MALELVKGNMVDTDGNDFSFSDEEYIGFYFSAHWCPPCRRFTPELARFYNAVKDKGEKFEIVFLSSDRNEAAFEEYFKDMPWKAVKFNKETESALCEMYDISGIPSLIIVDKNGETVTANGRGQVMEQLRSRKPTALNWRKD